MSATWRWFRLDLATRWRSLLVLTLLVTLASGTVMGTIAGARRGAGTVDRLLDQTRPATVQVLPGDPQFDLDALRSLPDVEAVGGVGPAALEVDGRLPHDFFDLVLPLDDQLLDTIERPVVLEGRLPDPRRPDEIVTIPAFVRTSGKSVGDTVTLRLFTPEQTDQFFQHGTMPDAAAGPALEATIVGVVRSMPFSEEFGDDPGFAVASPALFATYPSHLAGASRTFIVDAYVRLAGGEAAIPAFEARLAALTGRTDITVVNLADEARRRQDVARFEASALLVFALAAALASGVLLGQAIARHVNGAMPGLLVLHGLGMTPWQVRCAATLGPGAATTAGAIVGAAAAVGASDRFPIGNSARFEPTPGRVVDATVLLGSGAAILILVVLGSALAASLGLRGDGVGGARRSSIARAAARAGFPVPAVVGTRFALEASQGRRSAPVRPALVASVTGVTGVVAALTFSSAIVDASANPARFGQTYHLDVLVGFDDVDFGRAAELLPAIASDADVLAVNDARYSLAQAGEVTVHLFTLDGVAGAPPVALMRGRLPEHPGEIALAPRTVDALGVGVGGTVDLSGARGQHELLVTGVALVPSGFFNDYATGGWVAAATYDRLASGFRARWALVTLHPEADAAAVAGRIQDLGPSELDVRMPLPPLERDELLQVRTLPRLLAAFLAALALGAVGHAVTAAVRRRRHDLAVLRVLGMTPRQSRALIAAHATVIALVGVALGVPLGLALGRTVWRAVADSTPVHYVSPVAWVSVWLLPPLAIAAANLLAAGPARRAASMRPADVLRAE